MEADKKEYEMETLGTVVKLDDKSKFAKNYKVVIVERFIQDPYNSKGYYDYKGTFYPSGVNKNQCKGVLFNEEDIKTVLYYGYKDEKDENFVSGAKKQLKERQYKKSKI